jgi:RNA ligase (TIGR02306 family)
VEVTQIDAEEIQDRLLLSTVQKIKSLTAIPGKDRVEKVEFESVGYTAICEKLHKVGDLVVFTKYDSIVADIPPFEWMKDMKFRVKPKSFTIKDEDGDVIGKIYSQGIVVKLADVIEFTANRDCSNDNPYTDSVAIDVAFQTQLWEDGDDLTELLGTKKYIPQVSGKGNSLGNMQAKGTFPTSIVSKTDEMNLASKMKYLEFFKGKHVVARLKMEGSSLTTYIDPEDKELNVCSRNNNLKEMEGNKFWTAVNKNDLKTKLAPEQDTDLDFSGIVIQAELMGPGVQNNKLQLTEPDMYVFTLTNIKTKTRLHDDALINFCKTLNLKICPEVGRWEAFDLTFDQLQEIADKLEYLPGVPAEGMVIRPYVPEWCDKLQDWLSMKIINRNYSL